jgi:2-keto-4-pentenoate hydratase/2-oxohepta-3-ene-1,7-dioic acid hydratase in catechol pathway
MARISRRVFLEESALAGAGVAAATAAPGLLAAAEKAAEPGTAKNHPLRLCRYQKGRSVKVALYQDDHLVDLQQLAAAAQVALPGSIDLLDCLPPEGKAVSAVAELVGHYQKLPEKERSRFQTDTKAVKLLVPIAEPRKVILLAGNYAAHIIEGGAQAPERRETFPYFFWKPPSTTLTHPGEPIRIPRVSPDHVDWEIELGVIIGKRCQDVSEKEALNYVAGYSVCNDVSDRKFQINAGRKKRDKDSFFDWLHGKWHDTFLPMGPCVRSAVSVPDPQQFPMKLRVNGQVMQDASTNLMIFPVAALVSILSTFTTLEPGDVISTGTPAGVGAGRKPPVFLKKGDLVEAEIEGIGVLCNPVV